jgi:hypothetical protein
VQQGGKLTVSGGAGNQEFGTSTAISSDGKTAVVGVPNDDSSFGAVFVFTLSGSTWTEQAKLTPNDATNYSSGLGFGDAIAVSGDGNTIVAGAAGDNKGAGAGWVFTRSGSTWSQQGSKLTGSGEVGQAQVGSRLAISSDGNTVMLGGRFDNGLAGAAWVFRRSGLTWSQQGAKLTEAGEQGAGLFGSSISLNGDGSVAVIGSPGDKNDVGSAWVFTRSGSIWTQGAGLSSVSHGGGPGSFGGAVGISANGSTALVGEACYGRGAVWVFTHAGSTWTRRKELIVSVNRACYFGKSLALSADGNTVLVGTPNNGDNETGAAWVFAHTTGSNWTQISSEITPSDESGAGLVGSDVAISADGTRLLIAGPLDDQDKGAVWFFDRTGAPCSYPNTVKGQPGLSAYWRLGEASGNTAADAAGSHNGTYSSGVTLGTAGAVLGDANTSVTFNGTTGKVTLPSLGTASNWTVEGWTHLDSTAASSTHGDNALYASGSGVRLIVQPSGVYADDVSTGTSTGHIDPSTDTNIGVWVFWALVRTGSALTLYRNGVQIGTVSLSSEPPSNLSGSIGAQGSGYYLHGQADEVAVYKSALNATAVQQTYQCSGWG